MSIQQHLLHRALGEAMSGACPFRLRLSHPPIISHRRHARPYNTVLRAPIRTVQFVWTVSVLAAFAVGRLLV